MEMTQDVLQVKTLIWKRNPSAPLHIIELTIEWKSIILLVLHGSPCQQPFAAFQDPPGNNRHVIFYSITGRHYYHTRRSSQAQILCQSVSFPSLCPVAKRALW